MQGNSAQFLSLAAQLIVEFMRGEKKRSRFMERRKKDTFIAKQSFQNTIVHWASDKGAAKYQGVLHHEWFTNQG